MHESAGGGEFEILDHAAGKDDALQRIGEDDPHDVADFMPRSAAVFSAR